MTKPAYVTIEYKHKNKTKTIEGWLTAPDGEVKYMFITPSLDYDEDIIKIGIAPNDIISIAPAQSVREYGGMWEVGEKVKYSDFAVDNPDGKGKGKRPLPEMFDRVIEDDE